MFLKGNNCLIPEKGCFCSSTLSKGSVEKKHNGPMTICFANGNREEIMLVWLKLYLLDIGFLE